MYTIYQNIKDMICICVICNNTYTFIYTIADVGTHMAQHRGSHMISQTNKKGHVDQLIGLREKLEENAIFHGKISGFL